MNYRSARTLKNGQKITIKNAKIKDAEEISRVVNQVSKETRFLSRSEEDPVVTIEKEKKYIEEMDSTAYLLAKLNGKIVGYRILAVGKRSRKKHKAI